MKAEGGTERARCGDNYGGRGRRARPKVPPAPAHSRKPLLAKVSFECLNGAMI